MSFCMEIYPADICKKSINAIFVPLLRTFFESKESLKNWAGTLEAYFQVIKAQSLLVSDGV